MYSHLSLALSSKVGLFALLGCFLDENLSFAAGVAHDFYYQPSTLQCLVMIREGALLGFVIKDR